MVHDETARLVNNLTSHLDLLGVYYDEKKDRLDVYPVVGFASWEERDGDGGLVNNLYPIIFLIGGPVEEDIDLDPESDFLGVCISSGGKCDRKDWEEDIEILKSIRRAKRETIQ